MISSDAIGSAMVSGALFTKEVLYHKENPHLNTKALTEVARLKEKWSHSLGCKRSGPFRVYDELSASTLNQHMVVSFGRKNIMSRLQALVQTTSLLFYFFCGAFAHYYCSDHSLTKNPTCDVPTSQFPSGTSGTQHSHEREKERIW